MRIFPLSVLAIAISIFPFTISKAEASSKTFEQWCQQKDALSDGAKNTVEVLLKNAETQDCKVASKKLISLAELDVIAEEITDVEPIGSLTNLTSLNLSINQITDISPLASLTKLTSLSLSVNKIENVMPLAKLTALTFLDLGSNQISDIKPLSGLTELGLLSLSENQISDLKPLSSLKSLVLLNLSKTKFKPTDCPVQPTSICSFE